MQSSSPPATARPDPEALTRRVRDMIDRGEDLPTDDSAPARRSVRELVETVRRDVERRSRGGR